MTAGGQTESIGSIASRGIFWSLVQSWTSRLSTFILFALLARYLSPAEYGLAAAAATVLLLIGIIAEFGFGDAIIQRRGLAREDVNLPFYVSIGLSVVLGLAVAASAGWIETLLRAPGLAPVLIWLTPLAPITTLSAYQEFSYKRALAFKALAVRVLVANLVAGPAALTAAYFGAGVWSVVVQSYVSVLVGLVWLWSRPHWLPGIRLHTGSFVELARFGSAVLGTRLADFIANRLIEVVIILQFGVATFGLYAVGSRLYQVLMQLLQAALNDVSLTVLARVAGDRERLGRVYQQATAIAAYVAAPVFVLVAAVAPELCQLLFGAAWHGVDEVASPLLLLGAIQCVQYLNGPYISARGKPHVVFIIALCKYATMIAGLLLFPHATVDGVVVVFALSQLVATPLSFWATAREVGISLTDTARLLLPAVVSSTAGFAAASVARMVLGEWSGSPLLQAIPVGLAFLAVHGALLAMIGRQQMLIVRRFVTSRWTERRRSKVQSNSTDQGWGNE